MTDSIDQQVVDDFCRRFGYRRDGEVRVRMCEPGLIRKSAPLSKRGQRHWIVVEDGRIRGIMPRF